MLCLQDIASCLLRTAIGWLLNCLRLTHGSLAHGREPAWARKEQEQQTPGCTHMQLLAATIQLESQSKSQVTTMVPPSFRSTIPAHHAPSQWLHDCAGLSLTDHTLTVPLDYSGATEGKQQIFVREVVAHGRAKQQLPFLLFLQGAPCAQWSSAT